MNIKKTLLSVLAAPLVMIGCGSGTDGVTTETGSNEKADGEVVAVALLSSGYDKADDAAEVTSEVEANMNAAIAKNISEKVEGQLNTMLENGEIEMEDEDGMTKDINAGFNFKRGFFLDIVDERLPFAGGEMVLNGGVDLTIKYLGGGKLALVASGTLTSGLEGVEKAGVIKDLPYSLTLEGSNQMELNGSFAVTIKRWKVSAMSADITSNVVGSDVTATGTISDRSVTAAVNMMDLSLSIANPNILQNASAFTVKCSGDITFDMGNQTLASCTIAETCLSCE